jgi:hypothetical protein
MCSGPNRNVCAGTNSLQPTINTNTLHYTIVVARLLTEEDHAATVIFWFGQGQSGI